MNISDKMVINARNEISRVKNELKIREAQWNRVIYRMAIESVVDEKMNNKFTKTVDISNLPYVGNVGYGVNLI